MSEAVTRTFSCWALIYPSLDVEGEWVAHCLDFDIVSQGTSPGHAGTMIREACGIVVAALGSAAMNDPACPRRCDFVQMWHAAR